MAFDLYPHFYSMMFKELRTSDSYHSAIQYAHQAIVRLPDQEGVLHNFADAVITAIETGIELDPSLLTKAEEQLLKAMYLSPKYPKFYCTKGRLLALKKDYKAATESILKAIDLEDSSKSDYVLRINDYQNHLANIRNDQLNTSMVESIRELSESKDRLEKSLESAKTENLQMLGFFVAIITFTLGSFNLIKQEDIMDSVFLIFVLTGCLIISYIAFTVLFSNNQSDKWKILFASALGLLLLASGFSIHAFF
jgi:tetratricopeptide (TPR) repeat protein